MTSNCSPAIVQPEIDEPRGGRWIALSRDARAHPIVGFGQPVKPADPRRGSYSRFEAWADLLMEVCWKARQVINKGRTILLERGEMLAARKWLAERWNWTEKTVRWFIDRLDEQRMISHKSGHSDDRLHGRSVGVISVCNYDKYQTRRDLEFLLNGQSNGHSTATQRPHPYKETRIQEEEEVANATLFDESASNAPAKAKPARKKASIPEEYTSDFEEFWKLYPRRQGKAAAFRSWQKLSLPQKRRAYVALKRQLADLAARAKDPRGNYCPHPATWINEGRFDDDPESAARTNGYANGHANGEPAWMRQYEVAL
jgi:hypothetical protein